jgi:hypothetical protein
VLIDEAVNEFIQDKRLWFRDLHKDHKEDIAFEAKTKGAEFLPNTAKYIGPGLLLKPDEIDTKSLAFKEEIKKKSLALGERFQKEVDERDPEYMTPSEESDPDDKWDAETILTTNTNCDNHPGIIKFIPKIKVKNRVQLHTQFLVPVEGLNGLIPIAEVIEAKKEKKRVNAEKAFEEDSEISEQEEEEDAPEDAPEGEDKKLNPRKEAKKLLKVERREKRV